MFRFMRQPLQNINRSCFSKTIHGAQIIPNSLTPQTIATVKASASVLAEHGYTITRTMYGRMLTKYPDVAELFNPSHQIQLPGETHARQPWTLARSVHAYASNIDNLQVLTDAVERIAQKHVSLYVLPEQYAIVGENLLWAIKEVLGDAATPEIMAAWKEAYIFLADIFIQRESEIRNTKAQENGGWEGWRKFVVSKKIIESSEITSFYLKPKDGKPVVDFLPGQYTALRVKLPDGYTQRNYTLSSAPGFVDYRITVKREPPSEEGAPEGRVSSWLHDDVKEGDSLLLSVPCGDFFLQVKDDKPIVLISGGVGITPVLSMLEYIIENNYKNKIVMVNTAKNPSVEAMHGLLEKYRRKHLNLVVKTLYDEGSEEYPRGPITMEHLDSILMDRDAHYYFCGPSGFMQRIYKGLKDWNVPQEQIKYENFGPHDDLS